MAKKTLLCVEPDEAALRVIVDTLEPHGFEITNITAADRAVDWGRQHRPSLVIVSVEPRKVGYAICNKLKRSGDVRDIPLILTSAEEAPEKFEQHKTFKLRADEYMFKPLDRDELLRKVDALVGLGQAMSAVSEEIFLSSEVSAEIAIEADDIVDETGIPTPPPYKPPPPPYNPPPAPGAGTPGRVVELEADEGGPFGGAFDQEAEAAFAALQSKEHEAMPAEAGGASLSDQLFGDLIGGAKGATPAASAPVSESDGWSEEGATRISPTAFGAEDVPPALVSVPDAEPETAAAPVGAENPFAAESPFDAPAGAEAPGDQGEPTELAAPTGGEPEANASMADTIFDRPQAAPTDAWAEAPPAGAPEADASMADTMFDRPQAAPVDDRADGPPAAELEIPPGVLREADDAPPEPDAVHNTSVIASPFAEPSERIVAELQGRIHDLENERLQLRGELDELRGRISAQPMSKEKDLLGLREVINRKEKDLLDLRDLLDAKERQILDHKDRIREHERTRRDLEEKMLGMEKGLMLANERVAALTQDKERGLERERGLKARLDDAHVEIGKAHDELDVLKKRGATAEERARAELDKLRTDFEIHIADMEQVHRAEVTQLKAEHEASDASRDELVRGELARMEAEHAAVLEAEKKRAAEELASLEDRHEVETARMRRESDKALAAARDEHAAQLAAERQAHAAAVEAKERDHKNEIQSLRRRHEDELAAADERRQRELEEAEARRSAELEAAEGRRRAELQARDEQHHAAVAELDRSHFEEKAALSERHRAEIDQAEGRVSRAEGELAARTEELAETERKLQVIESEIAALRADVRNREVKLTQARERVADLEAKSADLEEQILRAYQKLRSDDKAVDKAKRALAVALTLLDDRGNVTTGSGAMVNPAPRPSSDEGST